MYFFQLVSTFTSNFSSGTFTLTIGLYIASLIVFGVQAVPTVLKPLSISVIHFLVFTHHPFSQIKGSVGA
jgi:hypothetical protein